MMDGKQRSADIKEKKRKGGETHTYTFTDGSSIAFHHVAKQQQVHMTK